MIIELLACCNVKEFVKYFLRVIPLKQEHLKPEHVITPQPDKHLPRNVMCGSLLGSITFPAASSSP